MVKTHFCKKIKEGKECGETISENFEKGRYSICRECRKLCGREQNIETKKFIESLQNKIKELEEKIEELENKTLI
jgi:hypothetical protein